MGSVKDLSILKAPTEKAPGIGRFVFSDRYSVFDWGEMPDHILKKGESLCIVSAYFFEKLEEYGINTHYRGIVENSKVKRLGELKNPSNIIEVKILRVIRPELKEGKYDYSIYQKERNNFLIPLEIIYRNSLPEGSSVFKRLKEGSLKLSDLHLKKMPKPGEILKTPVYEVSTKLEITDRYIGWEEAKNICNFSEKELVEIKKIISFINKLLTEELEKIGLLNEDGKIELGFDENRKFIVVDALGTLDECRFTYEGIPVSKEIARIYYRNTSWFKETEEAKKKNRINWKKLVKTPPPPLPSELSKAISGIYQSYANEITKKQWFDVPPLREILEKIKEFLI